MASTYTTSLRLNLQAAGDNINVWGNILNQGVFQLVDTAIAGYLAIAVTGDTTLSSANGTSDQARYSFLKFTGSLSVNATITIPSVSKSYNVWNATGKVLTITTGGGTTVSIDDGDIINLWCDATNVKTTTYGGLDLKSFIAASVLTATGTLPSVTGNAGKYIYTDGVSAFWRQPSTADLSDYNTLIKGVQVALAVAL